MRVRHRSDIKLSKRENIDDLDKNDLNELVGKKWQKLDRILGESGEAKCRNDTFK